MASPAGNGGFPPEPCPNFIQFSYAAVHYDLPVEQLYALRTELLTTEKSQFCCFVTSNVAGELAAERGELFETLSGWKRVDSAGKVRNNTGYFAPRGIEFLRWIARYRYMICLENSKEPGYITEKPFQAWFAGTVPIYDGGCVSELNPGAFIDASKGNVLPAIQALENSPDLYEARRRANLTTKPLSLAPFHELFRSRVLGRSSNLSTTAFHQRYRMTARFKPRDGE